MVWSIEWSQRAVRDLAGLERSVARRIIAKLEAAAIDPPRFFERLAGGDDHKLRVGDHRVLALLSHATRTILIERVGHRSTIYKRRR